LSRVASRLDSYIQRIKVIAIALSGVTAGDRFLLAWDDRSDDHPDIPDDHPDIPDDHPDIPDDHPDIPDDHPDIPDDHPDIPDDVPYGRDVPSARLYDGDGTTRDGTMQDDRIDRDDDTWDDR
jgi:hypothetical protein